MLVYCRSDPDSWSPEPVPTIGDDVYIDSTMYIVLDVTTPSLGTVNVFGRLEFLGTLVATIRFLTDSSLLSNVISSLFNGGVRTPHRFFAPFIAFSQYSMLPHPQ